MKLPLLNCRYVERVIGKVMIHFGNVGWVPVCAAASLFVILPGPGCTEGYSESTRHDARDFSVGDMTSSFDRRTELESIPDTRQNDHWECREEGVADIHNMDVDGGTPDWTGLPEIPYPDHAYDHHDSLDTLDAAETASSETSSSNCEALCTDAFCGPVGCETVCGDCEPDFECLVSACVHQSGACVDAADEGWDSCHEGELSEFSVGSVSSVSWDGVSTNEPTLVSLEGPHLSKTVFSWHTEIAGGGSSEVVLSEHSGGTEPSTAVQVNTSSQGHQQLPVLASLSNGTVVVTWESCGHEEPQAPGNNGSECAIFGRLFSDELLPLGDEVQLNDTWQHDQKDAAAATSGSGDALLVVWSSSDEDGDGFGVFAQLFDEGLVPKANTVQINSFIHGDQRQPAVVAVPDGYVVVWTSCPPGGYEQGGQPGGYCRIVGRRLDEMGNSVSEEFIVSVDGGFFRSSPALAASAQVDYFMVAWESNGQDGSYWGVYGRQFDFDGTPLAEEFQVNLESFGEQRRPSVSLFPDGRSVFAWDSGPSKYQGIPGYKTVKLRWFGAEGEPLSEEVRADSNDMQSGEFPSVIVSAAGDAVVCWLTWMSYAPKYIAAARFDGDGNRLYY